MKAPRKHKRTFEKESQEGTNRKLLLTLLQNCSTKGKKLSELLKTTPESNGAPQPAVQLEYDKTKPVHFLPKPHDIKVNQIDLRYAIENRKSIRSFSDKLLRLDELTWLLWTTQGVRDIQIRENKTRILRNVPSAGSLHPFETYLIVNKVEGLKPGVYRYLAISHELLEVKKANNLQEMITIHCGSQSWVNNSAVTFLWTFVPNRAIWRHNWDAHKLFMEAGHICQNLYLAAEAVMCGVCAICVFDLDRFHKLLDIDGIDEILVYIATVGKRKEM